MTRILGASFFAAGAAALLLGCSDPTGPVRLVDAYHASGFLGEVLEETETHRVIGLSQVLELGDDGIAVRRTVSRRIVKATLDETVEELVIEMHYELDGDLLRTSLEPCTAEICSLALLVDPPDYLVRDGGQRLIELTSPTERRTYTPSLINHITTLRAR